jgi:hypothetical protein
MEIYVKKAVDLEQYRSGYIFLALNLRQKYRHFLTAVIKQFRHHAVVDAFFNQSIVDAAQHADKLFHRQFQIENGVTCLNSLLIRMTTARATRH